MMVQVWFAQNSSRSESLIRDLLQDSLRDFVAYFPESCYARPYGSTNETHAVAHRKQTLAPRSQRRDTFHGRRASSFAPSRIAQDRHISRTQSRRYRREDREEAKQEENGIMYFVLSIMYPYTIPDTKYAIRLSSIHSNTLNQKSYPL